MPRYVGRFAPSPTGPLHLGSLVAALGSFLRAKSLGGRWLVRIDDIDPPREPPTACGQILHALNQFGLQTDAPILFQSRRLDRYREVLGQLIQRGLVFPCHCTRSQLAGRSHHGVCKRLGTAPPSWRLLMRDELIEFDDACVGLQRENPSATCGDVVLWRADGWPSYQLASVVDDLDCAVSEVVRGADLLDSTARQIALMNLLGGPIPSFAHLPLVLGPDGQKLSKQNLAPALDADGTVQARIAALNQALAALSIAPISAKSLGDFYQQATLAFRLPTLAATKTAPY